MDQQRLLEILWNVGQFFVHPLFFLTLAAAIATGYFRVKRERKDFRTRLVLGWTEFTSVLRDSWLFGLVISLVLALVGILFYEEFLLIVSLVAILALLLFQFQVLSAAYILFISVVIWMLVDQWSYSILVGPFTLSAIQFSWDDVWPVAVLTGLLLIAEGLLLKRQGLQIVSPQLVKTKRGGSAVQYKVKRLWLLPLVLLVPGEWFTGIAGWWPLVQFGETSFAVLAFPYVTGFQQLSKSVYPFLAVPQRAKHILILGSSVAVIAVLGIITYWFGLVALVAAFIGRLVLDIQSYRVQNTGHYAVAPVSEGIQIAGVLKGSPADKMGLEIGEKIVKVNGQRVSNEQELYEAIQINAAHCRLEVLDHNNELRLKQQVIFRHDHHRLGLMIARSVQ